MFTANGYTWRWWRAGDWATAPHYRTAVGATHFLRCDNTELDMALPVAFDHARRKPRLLTLNLHRIILLKTLFSCLYLRSRHIFLLQKSCGSIMDCCIPWALYDGIQV